MSNATCTTFSRYDELAESWQVRQSLNFLRRLAPEVPMCREDMPRFTYTNRKHPEVEREPKAG